ncbi:MAG: tetratricopeptide repeat protein [Candidatus Krumholzibacteriota bacterium]|nr:tetratricopeptide repeat protein [Candidatus Krumholzibacteriota bacterium]
MLVQLKNRTRSMSWAAGAVALVLAMVVAGCGDGDKSTGDVSVGTRSRPVATTAPRPVPVVAPAPAPIEKEAIAVTLPSKEVSYEEAEAAFSDRRYAEAVELFTAYTERKSENPWGFYMLGLSAWKAGNHERAEAAFEQSLALDTKHVKSMLNLSRVLLDSDRPGDALVKIDEALTIDPESNTARRLQGRAFYQQGRNEEAVAAYRQAVQSDNQDAWSMNNIALILIAEERFDEALAPLARAVEIRSDVSIFQNNLGMALERTGHFGLAVDAYDAACTLDGSYGKALANRDRLSIVMQDPSISPVDLAVSAQSFVDEIAGWSETIALGEQTDLAQTAEDVAEDVVENVAVSSASDTTVTRQEP